MVPITSRCILESNPQKLQQFLPDQLRVTDGSAVAYVSDFACTASEEDLGAPYSDPAQRLRHRGSDRYSVRPTMEFPEFTIRSCGWTGTGLSSADGR